MFRQDHTKSRTAFWTKSTGSGIRVQGRMKSPMHLTPCRIAVIEDSPLYLAAIESALADFPATVLVGTADTAEGGIKVVDQVNPDLLVVDLFLKQGTGIEVLQHCQSQERKTKIAVMTNAPSRQLEEHCRALGATAFHDKAEGFDWIPAMAGRRQ
jgi:DNA-binding NarL/FixJ family response regulator